ncbi:hypothetical protein ACI65C_001467 [Semiaphis heraclei]
MYIQNVSMSMTELQFLVYCFGLYVKFQSINEDLSAIKSETISTNRYPFVLKSEEHKSIEVRPSVRSIELLKMRHQFICQSVSDLNKIYSIQLGMSISVLFIMLLFDIYEAVATKLVKTKSFLLLYGWLTQYIFRFAIVILMSHITTKQVIIVDSSLKLVYFLALAMTCVMNIKNASATICSLSECKNSVKTEVLAMFSRSIAIACLLSRITVMYKSKSDFPNYVNKFEEYELYFPSINEEMATLKLKNIVKNRYPVVLQSERRSHNNTLFIGLETYGSSPLSMFNLANRVELLKMKHQFVRGIVVELNDLYGIQLGLSICLLFIMTLFDIYGEVSVESNVTKTHVLFYGWLLQYSFRFFVIVLTSHVTTTQLQLFLSQLSSRPVEFTAGNLFTLDIHLITSVS